jgi:hypothetical protein
MHIILSGNNYKYFNSSLTLNDGKWHHYSVYIAGNQQTDINNAKIIVDGTTELTAGTIEASGPPTAWTDFNIGYNWYGYIDAVIDEVRIYNRALAADEVKRLYNMGR